MNAPTPIHPIDALIASAAQERPPGKREERRQKAQAQSLSGGLRGIALRASVAVEDALRDIPTVIGAQLSLTRRRGKEFKEISRDLEMRAKSAQNGHTPLNQSFYSAHELEERGWTAGMLQRLGVPDQHGLQDGRTVPLYSRSRISLLEAHPHFALNILSANRHKISSERSLEMARIEATQKLHSGQFTVPAGNYEALQNQARREAAMWWQRELARRASNGQSTLLLPENDLDLIEGFTLTLLRMATPLKLALSTPGWEMDPRDTHELTMIVDSAIVRIYPQLSGRIEMEREARERDLAPPEERQAGFGS